MPLSNKNERDGDRFDEASSDRLSDVDMASESLLPHMFQGHKKGRQPWQKQKRLCMPFLWLLAGSVLGALVPWLIGMHQSRRGQDHGFHFVPQTDPIGFFPPISHKIQYFEKTSEYISNHSSPESLQKVKKLWEKLIPSGEGFLYISDEEATKYDFPTLINYKVPPEHGVPGKPLRGKAYLIMAEYDRLYQGLSPGDDFTHVDHCIDWIRQSLMCAGDVALSGNMGPVTGHWYQFPHVCKNWDEVYDFMDRRHVDNRHKLNHAVPEHRPTLPHL
uniref:Cyclochlorotine biosynthesis protein O n=1 Tax=Colletotrichum fructicola (strain Nara gc5) TaxID=1213859 RepID=L2GBR2_COLFN